MVNVKTNFDTEIYSVNPDISPRKMYTHKIYDLCEEATGRYELHFTVRTDSIERALQLAENWLDGIEI